MGGSVVNGVPQTLFGREICYLETAPALGTSGDIALLDPTFYVIGTRQGMIIESSNGPGFLRDVVTFKLTVRIQGQSTLSGPITMDNGEIVTCAAVLK